MRVGLFSDTYTPDVNGVVTSIVALQKALEAHGHEVFVVTTAQSALHIQRDGNTLRLPGIEVKKLYGYRMSGPFSVIGLADVRAMNLDLIHVHTEFGIGTFARICSKMLNIPLVATYHTQYEDYTHYLNIIQSNAVDRTLKKIVSGWSQIYGDLCNALISPSQKTKDLLLEYGVDKPIHVIPTGLDIDKFSASNFTSEERMALRNRLSIREDQKMLLFVGRIAEEKSIDIILEAMKAIKNNLPIICVIVGGGPSLDTFKKMASDFGIEDVVRFTDKVVPSEVPSYYNAADMFVSASLSETQGLTFIEAMASGLAVFARERNILSDLIDEDESGYYFDDANMLVEKIQYYLNKSCKEQSNVCACAVKKVEPYSSEKFYSSIIKVYEHVVFESKDSFIVSKIKMKHDNYFEVTFETNEEESYSLYLKFETYFSDHIEKGKLITREKMNKYREEDILNRAYIGAIRFLSSKDRTRKEMYDFLSQKTALSIKQINSFIDAFEKHGYIDDERFVTNEIESMKASLFGEKKIVADLIKRGIPYEMVQEQLKDDDDERYVEAAKNAIQGMMGAIKNKNTQKAKEYVQSRLYRMGYPSSIILKAMEDFDFEKEDVFERELLAKEYDKQLNRLEKKYEGKELKSKLITTLIRKGYEYDQVMDYISEKEI